MLDPLLPDLPLVLVVILTDSAGRVRIGRSDPALAFPLFIGTRLTLQIKHCTSYKVEFACGSIPLTPLGLNTIAVVQSQAILSSIPSCCSDPLVRLIHRCSSHLTVNSGFEPPSGRPIHYTSIVERGDVHWLSYCGQALAPGQTVADNPATFPLSGLLSRESGPECAMGVVQGSVMYE